MLHPGPSCNICYLNHAALTFTCPRCVQGAERAAAPCPCCLRPHNAGDAEALATVRAYRALVADMLEDQV